MTPLAQMIAKELAIPIKDRTEDEADIRSRITRAHCFDLTEVADMVDDLAWKILGGGHATGCLAFLPAERTWIEFRGKGKGEERLGWLIEASPDGTSARMWYAQETITVEAPEGSFSDESGCDWWSLDHAIPLAMWSDTNSAGSSILPDRLDYDDDMRGIDQARVHACLALINSPHVIGRRQHMPHRGLERKLIKAKAIQGKFPLQAWTEITLRISSSRDASGDASVEAHLTGERALHFCRAHLRVRLGRLEIVRGHWRGDASVGIKRSRYKVAA